jgi:ubiquinone/menaquinone biosynthesis C-methylase UbiE
MGNGKLQGDKRYYVNLASRARQQYSQAYATGYRESDEQGVKQEWSTHLDLGGWVKEVSASFDRPIDVLDLACGCGRYFHCLRNLQSLIGVDISFDMLVQAQHPVNEEQVNVPPTLICANIADIQFLPHSFDMIYAIGVFGPFLPIDLFFMTRIEQMLKQNGVLLFTAVDSASPQSTSWKRRCATFVLPVLPPFVYRRVRPRLGAFTMSEEELNAVLNASPFKQYNIKRRYLPEGRIDFMCFARKCGGFPICMTTSTKSLRSSV